MKDMLAILIVTFILIFAYVPISNGDTQTCIQPPEGLVSWWPFDGITNDIADGNNGTLMGGVSFAPGKVGRAFSFDGVDDYVFIPFNENFDFNPWDSFTIAAWVNPATITSEWQALVMKSPTNGEWDWGLYIYVDSARKKFATGSYRKGSIISRTEPEIGRWYHVAVTYEGRYSSNEMLLSLYVNGNLENSIIYHPIITSSTGALAIGRRGESTSYPDFFKGLIDDVRIYNRSLSAGEITAIFNTGSPLSGLVSQWQGEENAEDSVDDNDGTLMGGPVFVDGKVGQAVSFDGVDDYIEILDAQNLDIQGSLTVDAWVQLNELKNPGTCNIISKENSTLPLDVNYNLHVINNRLFFALTFSNLATLKEGTGGCDPGGCFVTGNTDLTAGTFHHVAGVYDDATKTMKVYLNGALDGEATFNTTGSPMINNQNIRIGKRNAFSTGTEFKGLIDEVEIFNRALSDNEIAVIYNAGSAGKCKPIEVAVDIKPWSCPNPLDTRKRHVLPVAILGTENFDVTMIDPASVRLEGVAPLRWSLEDVATPFEPYTGKDNCFEDCNRLGPDGYNDLILRFRARDVVRALGKVTHGQCRVLKLTGNLKGGTPIKGEDVVIIKKKHKHICHTKWW